EGHHEETDLLIKARHAGQAPDVDGMVIINDSSDMPLSVGQIRKALVTEVEGFDLIAKIIP
ncbi:MAG: 30S ribosomal protein S12 methylthiotransferase RimO, partial [Bdellovibrionales bacterium]|nr:30S ribosomal protein S12 methylthiotransferase RimO [Bdellovibrionales bacterium]